MPNINQMVSHTHMSMAHVEKSMMDFIIQDAVEFCETTMIGIKSIKSCFLSEKHQILAGPLPEDFNLPMFDKA